MASIMKQPNGRKAIQIVCPDGKRRTIRLGKVDMPTARDAKHFIESIASRRWNGLEPTAAQVDWLKSLTDEIHKRLANAGIVEPRTGERPEMHALEAFVKCYIDKRTDLTPATRRKYGQTQKLLVEYFGSDREIESITEAEAEDWRRWMKRYVWKEGSEGKPDRVLADATISKHVKRAKTVFQYAVKSRYMATSPLESIKGGSEVNRDRDYFVERSDADKVLTHCPDHLYRLAFALARFGGFRVCEILTVTWEAMVWDENRIVLDSPKTGKRIVPMFSELRPYLDEAQERAPDGQSRLMSRFPVNANLSTTMEKHILRAGVMPWPKLFQNLRATRRTELEDRFPSHVCDAWLGHSTKIARKHYLQLTQDHWTAATKSDAVDFEAMQKAMQQVTV